MLDEGRNHDWFNDPHIRMYGIVAAIGFVAFVIWELTEKNPIVDLRIFRHRGFVGAATTYSVGFGAFFASIVILPLWLQSNMGYTATWAGYATGIMGILAVLCSPLVGKAVEKFDPRMIVCLGILGLAGDHAVADVDVQQRRHLPADGVADAHHRRVHGDVLRARDRSGHGQRRS